MEMVADNLPERANHLQHCRNCVAQWSMRQVIDYLHQYGGAVAEYADRDSTEIMSEIDASNRETAARHLAGDPQLACIRSMHGANRVALLRAALPAIAPNRTQAEHDRAAERIARDIGGAE